VLYLLLCRVLQFVVLFRCGDRAKEIEICFGIRSRFCVVKSIGLV
jgi:hypothetical protein